MFDEDTLDEDVNAINRRLSRRKKKYGQSYTKENVYERVEERKKRRDKRIKKGNKEHQSELLENLFESLYPCYKCSICGEVAESIPILIDHYIYDHGLEKNYIPPIDKSNPDHIILEYLIFRFKKNRGKAYLKISNNEIWDYLLLQLGYSKNDKDKPAPSTIHYTLEKFGLLKKGEREKKRLGYDSKGRRVYHIKRFQFEQVILNSKFPDLKIEWGKEVPSVPSKNNEDDKKITEDTKDFSTWEIK